MDEGFSKAVLKVFVELHRQGLLYRDKRLVNWDPGLGTAISDLEVETTEVAGKFWHLRYPLEDGSGSISVARSGSTDAGDTPLRSGGGATPQRSSTALRPPEVG